MNSEYIVSLDDRILVTGSNGFIGTKVVEILLEYGFSKLRCFVRPASRLERLKEVIGRFSFEKNVEVVTGDLLSQAHCRDAAEGVSVVYHLAAGVEKSFAGAFMNSALATRNLMDAFLERDLPKRFVNVSSFAVYSNLSLKRNALLDETCPLEAAPQERFDAYGFGKLKQEEMVREYMKRYGLPAVTLRPGYVFGPGKQELSGRIGIKAFGPFIQVNGSNRLPLTFVKNCAEAIVLAGLRPGIDGEVFNIIDDELLTARQFLRACKRTKRFRSIRVPYWLAYGACFAWEKYSKWSNGQLPPVFNPRRCAAEWKSQRYSNEKLKDRLGWKPRISMEQAMERFLAQFASEEIAQRSEVRSQRPEVKGLTSEQDMLRIAIVGCGKIADQHVQAIRRIPDCIIVGLCDRELLMARQLAERSGINAYFTDLRELLETTTPDVVHITTPPQSHYPLARECLQAERHVYLEKPFTVSAKEAESLIELAERKNVKITAGHNLQFTSEMLEMRRLVKSGFLGGKPIHVESYFSYDLGDKNYAGALLGNRQHWVRQLPGQLLHNIISHGLAKLAEFLDDDLIEIVGTAHQSEQLRNLGAQEVLDELRVLIRDKSGTTAFFCFSTQVRGLNQLRIYGPAGSITADVVTGTILRNPNRSYKSYLTYFIPPLRSAKEHFRNASRNVANFARRRLYQDFGMKELIERFYDSIRKGDPLPIPYREILSTARIMDEIFAQVYPAQGQRSEIRSRKSDVSGQRADAVRDSRIADLRSGVAV